MPSALESVRSLPQSLEAERAVLGSVLLDNSALYVALEMIGKDDFFSENHRIAFERMLALAEKNRTVDLVTLSEELSKEGLMEKAGGAAYLASLTDGVPLGTTASVNEYARIVKEKSIIRRLINASNNVITRCLEGTDSHRFRGGFLDHAKDWPRITRALGRLAQAPLYIEDTPALSIMQLRAKARRLKAEKGLDLLIVDYLQLVTGHGRFENRTQEVSYISRGLKSIAKELKVPVLALSQLSRAPEQRPGQRPQLSDLRESGSIEQDADVVVFIYRDRRTKEDEEFQEEPGGETKP